MNKIKIGRDFMKNDVESEFCSDQMKKLPQPPLVKEAMRKESIALPTNFEDLKISDSFIDIVNQRKSSRVYTEENLTLLELSYLLWATQGIKEIRGKKYATIRNVPSGGARHGFETYLMINKVEGLKRGKYHYLPWQHRLEYLGEVEAFEEVVSASLCEQSWATKASVIFYWSFVGYRCEWRYDQKSHRVALIDVGHVGENLYLACSALHLGVCAIAAFNNSVCDPLFELDGDDEFIIYSAPVGKIKEENKAAEDAFYAFVREEGL